MTIFVQLFNCITTNSRDITNIPIANAVFIKSHGLRLKSVPFDLRTKDLSMMAVNIRYSNINYVPNAYRNEAREQY